jgi:hypothetical protein
MAEYLCLIYSNEAEWETSGPEVFDQVMKGHAHFGETHGAKIRGGNALQPAATATTIRPDNDGGPLVTDGPFAETKEALGGYYLIEAANLDEAITIAKDIPAPFGGVEVRPIRVFD